MLAAGALSAVFALCAAAQPAGDGAAQANVALQNGEADKAMTLLNSLPATAETHNLRCRVLMTLEHWDAAASECEQAVQLDGSSNNHMWLARALGERADRASFMSAYSLGKRTRVEFETAVRLNPRNADAMADLASFIIRRRALWAGAWTKPRTWPRNWTRWIRRGRSNCADGRQRARRITTRRNVI